MARNNFNDALDLVLKHEGGWADHPRDPGGATMKGVTLATFRRYHPNATKHDLKAIGVDDLRTIYRDGYWRPVRGDDLPAGVDFATFDFAVNSGPSRSAKYLQAVVGVERDGKIGVKTLTAVRNLSGMDVIKKLCAKRLSFVRGLSTFDVFGRGWSRRIAEVEAKAVSMWMAIETPTSNDVRREVLRDEASAATKVGASQARSGKGAAGGGSLAAGGDVVATGDLNAVTIVIAASLALIAIVMLVKARHNKERAQAYAVEAAR